VEINSGIPVLVGIFTAQNFSPIMEKHMKGEMLVFPSIRRMLVAD